MKKLRRIVWGVLLGSSLTVAATSGAQAPAASVRTALVEHSETAGDAQRFGVEETSGNPAAIRRHVRSVVSQRKKGGAECEALTARLLAFATDRDLALMTADCFDALPSSASRAIPRSAWIHIPPEAFNRFDSRLDWREVTPEQVSWITQRQWTGLSRRNLRRAMRLMRREWLAQIDLDALPPDGLRAIWPRRIPDLSDEQLRRMDAHRIFEMKRHQVLAFTPHQLRIIAEVGGERFLERLRSHEDSGFRALQGLDYGVHLIGDSYAQLTGVAAQESDTEADTSFGLGLDVEEVAWHLRAVIRGGVAPFELRAGAGDVAFGQSMLTPESQPLYFGLSSRWTLHVFRVAFLGLRSTLHIGQLRWQLDDGDDATEDPSVSATPFSTHMGLEIWFPFSAVDNYADIRLFAGPTLHGVGIVGNRDVEDGFYTDATDNATHRWNVGLMMRASLRINRIEVHADVRYVRGNVPGLSGWTFVPSISFAPGATIRRWCHSVECLDPDEENALERASANLTGQALHGDYTGVNFSNATLTGANLSGARLVGANLTGADLRGADLTRADLRGALLCGARFDGAQAGDADFTGAYVDSHTTGASAFEGTVTAEMRDDSCVPKEPAVEEEEPDAAPDVVPEATEETPSASEAVPTQP